MTILIGIFVGGRGTRMGHVPKGLLPLPDGRSVLARLLDECRAALPAATLGLVGDATPYSNFALPAIADDPRGIGPIGGLRGLLLEAARQNCGSALALACDMPELGRGLIARLAGERSDSWLLAPCAGGRWDPLCGRYATSALPAIDAAIAAGERSLQRVFARLAAHAHPLELSADEQRELHDWDSPEDMR